MLFDWSVNIFRWFTALAYCVQNVYTRFQDIPLFDPLIIHSWMQYSCQTLNNTNITIPVFYKLRARDLYYSLYNSYLLCLSNTKIQSLRSSMAMEEHDPDGYWQRESSCIDAHSSKYHSSFTWILARAVAEELSICYRVFPILFRRCDMHETQTHSWTMIGGHHCTESPNAGRGGEWWCTWCCSEIRYIFNNWRIICVLELHNSFLSRDKI